MSKTDQTKSRAVEGYVIGRCISAGDRGEVYEGRDDRHERPVAIRFIPASIIDDVELRTALAARLGTCLSLTHQNLAGLLDMRIRPELSYVISELAPGVPLEKRITAARGPVSRSEAVRILGGVLAGLACLHSRGIVHGDLTPKTVIVDDESVRLLGVAWPRGEDDVASGDHLEWSSPEVLLGGMATIQSDLYQTGLLAAALLTGRTGAARAAGDPGWRDLPGDLWRWIVRCMATDPETRFANADEACRALHGAPISQPPARATSSAQPAFDRAKSPTRKRRPFDLFLGALLLAAGALLIARLCGPAPYARRLEHTLWKDTAVITWESERPYVGAVRVTPKASDPLALVSERSASTRHGVTLRALSPNTSYAYHVVYPNGDRSEERFFLTPAATILGWTLRFRGLDTVRLAFTTNYAVATSLVGRRRGRSWQLPISAGPSHSHAVVVEGITPRETIDKLRVVLDPGGRAAERPVGRIRGPVGLAEDIVRSVASLDPAWVAREILRHIDGGDKEALRVTVEATRYCEVTALLKDFETLSDPFFASADEASEPTRRKLYRALLDLAIIDGALASRKHETILDVTRHVRSYVRLDYPSSMPAGKCIWKSYEIPRLLLVRKPKRRGGTFVANPFSYVVLPSTFRQVAGVNHRFAIDPKALAKAHHAVVAVVTAHLEPLSRLELRFNGRHRAYLFNTARSFTGFCLDPNEAHRALRKRRFAPFAHPIVARVPAAFLVPGQNRLSITCRGTGSLQGCNAALFELIVTLD